MMIMKHHTGHGAWHMHEVASGLAFSGHHTDTEVRPTASEGVTAYGLALPDGSDFWALDTIPSYDAHPEVHLVSLRPSGETFVRWVRWVEPDGEARILVTDAPVFICNDRGDTIERLR